MKRTSLQRHNRAQTKRSSSVPRTVIPRRLLMLVIVTVVLAGGSTVITSGSAAHASALASRPVFAQGIALYGISCTSATACTVVGTDVNEPIHAAETGGAWGVATVVPSAVVPATFGDVSCTSATDCTAVGDTGGPPCSPIGQCVPILPIHETESAGVWGKLTEGSESVGLLFDVSCTSAKDCTAVGIERSEPIYETETAGTWGAATDFSAPEGSSLFAISCTSSKNCTAVGADADQPIYTSETSGKWGAVRELTAPGISMFDGVSCTSAADCTAVGEDGNDQPIYATETAGLWGAPTEVAAPSPSGFSDVSCTSALDCTAVGGASEAFDKKDQPFYARETAGVWGAATEVSSPLGGGSFDGVSCTSAEDCTAVGDDGHGYAIYPTERAGVWPKVPTAPRIDRVTPGNKSVRVAWAAPASDGGASVHGYTASAVSGGYTFTCTTSSRTSCTIHGLTNGKPYAVFVIARNPAGSSANSATKTATPRG